jgi:hypothetical protein
VSASGLRRTMPAAGLGGDGEGDSRSGDTCDDDGGYAGDDSESCAVPGGAGAGSDGGGGAARRGRTGDEDSDGGSSCRPAVGREEAAPRKARLPRRGR